MPSETRTMCKQNVVTFLQEVVDSWGTMFLDFWKSSNGIMLLDWLCGHSALRSQWFFDSRLPLRPQDFAEIKKAVTAKYCDRGNQKSTVTAKYAYWDRKGNREEFIERAAKALCESQEQQQAAWVTRTSKTLRVSHKNSKMLCGSREPKARTAKTLFESQGQQNAAWVTRTKGKLFEKSSSKSPRSHAFTWSSKYIN